jgi:hypothetical protein
MVSISFCFLACDYVLTVGIISILDHTDDDDEGKAVIMSIFHRFASTRIQTCFFISPQMEEISRLATKIVIKRMSQTMTNHRMSLTKMMTTTTTTMMMMTTTTMMTKKEMTTTTTTKVSFSCAVDILL